MQGIDKVLLVGGMSKMPVVARRLAEAFPELPPAELTDPDLAVAKGAAIYGQKKELENYVISDLVAQGKLAEGQTIADANPVDLSKAVATTASEYGLASTAVADLVQTQVSNVTSRGFGVIVMDRETGTEYVDFLAHANDSLPITVSELLLHQRRRPASRADPGRRAGHERGVGQAGGQQGDHRRPDRQHPGRLPARHARGGHVRDGP